MKKGPLSKKEKAHIEGSYKQKNVEEMAKELDRSCSIVEKYVMKMSFDQSSPNAPDSGGGGEKQDPPTSTLLARKEDRGVVIMTKEASMAADESKAKRKENGTTSRRMSRFIHRIKDK